MSNPIVVVGAGLAAAKAVEQLRESGFGGPVVVYGDEPHLPYERPPLSKSYLMGQTPFEKATVHDQEWYDGHGIDLRLGVAVTRIDADAKAVHTPSGTNASSDPMRSIKNWRAIFRSSGATVRSGWSVVRGNDIGRLSARK